MRKVRKAGENYVSERLLLALAEHMKLPLLQIARQAELGKLTGNNSTELTTIELTADSSLRLIDNFLMSARLASEQIAAQLEPVSLSAVLYNVAHELQKQANEYQCELQIHLSGRYEPVMAHRIGLEAALASLGQVFIEAQSNEGAKTKPIVKIAAHRGKKGIVAGMFTDSEGLSSDILRQAHRLYGYNRQPFTQLTSADGAGIFVAENIIKSMSARLRISHHQKMAGLAATFMSSKQLSLV